MHIDNKLTDDIITALQALKDNAELDISMTEKWQNERVIALYRADIKLAERLLALIKKER